MVPRILLPLIGLTLLAGVTLAEDVTESPCESVAECNTCTNLDLECISCPGKALLVDGSGCNDCPSNCLTCEDEGTAGSPDVKCTLCANGYVLNAEKECTECSTGCQYCNTTSDSTVCQTCYEPNSAGKYYARNDADGTCLECPTKCNKCTVTVTDDVASTVCSSCVTGYALNSDKVCKVCPDFCSKCSINGDGVAICSTCSTEGATKYVQEKTDGANKCLECDCGELNLCNGEPRSISSKSKCSGCPAGEYLDTGAACQSCDDGCETCENSASMCQSCSAEKFFFDGTSSCISCQLNCKECKDTSTCDTCDERHGVRISTRLCQACEDDHCNNCMGGTTTCTGCEDGFYFDGSAATKCTACTDSNCMTCDSAADTCDMCNTGYVEWMGSCFQRECEDPNCKTCAMGTCTDCNDGYGLASGGGVCTECTDATNCLKCSTDLPALCEICKDGFGVVGGSCTQCTDTTNCLNCDGGAGMCDTCIDMMGAISNTCTACDDSTNCLTCDTAANMCDKCVDGFYAATGVCTACSIITDCTKCTSGTVCTECGNNKVLKASDGAGCYTCDVDECTSCESDNMCETCAIGYELKSDKTCVKCDDNCASGSCSEDANGAATCSLCIPGHILNTGTNGCDACDANCGVDSGDCTYTTGDGVKCINCAAGYASNGVTCDACPPGCTSCSADANGNLACSACFATRYQSTGPNVCTRCPSNCIECSETDGEMICSKCAANYALNSEGNECKSCPGQCTRCAYSGGNVICQECLGGTGLSGNRQSCTACSTLTFSNCATCTSADSNEVATCLSCQPGYTFRDDEKECTACSSLTDCNVCEDKPFECSSCKEGFSETEDRLCAHLCYECEGNRESCGDFDFVGLSNSTEACFEGACVAVWDKNADTHHRGCANVTCSPSNVERCDDGICTQCCVGDKCNSFTLTGMSGANAISQTLAFVMVTLAAIGLLK